MLGVNTFYIISDHNTSAEALSLDQAPDWLKIRVKKVKPNPSQLLILFIRRWLPRTKMNKNFRNMVIPGKVWRDQEKEVNEVNGPFDLHNQVFTSCLKNISIR